MDNKKLWALANNTMKDIKERQLIIDEISASADLKQELALIVKLKDLGKEKKKSFLQGEMKNSGPSAYAKSSLSEIRHAAFGKNKQNDELTSLPITDNTLDDFLSDEDEKTD